MEERKVFISHSAKDSDWARSFAEALKRRGVSVWFDELCKRASLCVTRSRPACVAAMCWSLYLILNPRRG
jgi:hypothetical protein